VRICEKPFAQKLLVHVIPSAYADGRPVASTNTIYRAISVRVTAGNLDRCGSQRSLSLVKLEIRHCFHCNVLLDMLEPNVFDVPFSV
jgi:hypothetical protein